MKKIKSIQERKKVIEEYRKSGFSVAQFCRERKLIRTTFYSWLKKNTNLKENKFNFVSLSLEDQSLENSPIKKHNLEKIIMRTLSGIAIEFPASISVCWFSSLIKELK